MRIDARPLRYPSVLRRPAREEFAQADAHEFHDIHDQENVFQKIGNELDVKAFDIENTELFFGNGKVSMDSRPPWRFIQSTRTATLSKLRALGEVHRSMFVSCEG